MSTHAHRRPGFIRRHPRLTFVGGPVAVVVGLLAVLAGELQYARGREYARDPDYTLDRTFPGEGPTIELAVVGDSTVAGLGAATLDDTLPIQVGLELAAQTGRAVHVRGYGVSGATTQDVVDRQLPDIPTDFDIMVFEIGSNDIVHTTKLPVVERQTHRLLEAGARHASLVVLGSAGRLDTPNFKRPLRDLVVWRATQVRARQKAVARKLGVGFVEIGADPVASDFNATKGAVSDDRFHPAGPGYAVWAHALAAAAAEQLTRVQSPA
jgi:lysophospholipase L1-like esterase